MANVEASRARDDLIALAHTHIREAVEASKGFPDDPRLEKAQMLLVGALAELVRYERGIGGPQ